MAEKNSSFDEESNEVIKTAKEMFYKSLTYEFFNCYNAIECIVPVVADNIKNSYKAHRQVFEGLGKLEEGKAEELILFHGTSLESISSILESSFDVAAEPCRKGKMMSYGRGTYFSDNPMTSLRYGSSLLLCKVLPGRAQQIKTWTGQLAETIPKEWNSRTVFTKDGKFYVIPSASQILPFCVINCVMNFPGSLNQFPPRLRDHASHTAYLIKKELSLIYKNPKPGIFVTPERNDTFYKIHALITGGFDSAYDGGLFHFQLYVPTEYPFR